MSDTLIDRWYTHTVPGHGPSPVRTVTLAVTTAIDWRRGELVVTIDGGRTFGVTERRYPVPRELVEARRSGLRGEVARQCAGLRRRQMRRRRDV